MPRLAIYLSEHCDACAYARTLAATIAEQFPRIEVSAIDIDGDAPAPVPDRVFAVPAYLLDGRDIWIGNSARGTMERTLAEAAGKDGEG